MSESTPSADSESARLARERLALVAERAALLRGERHPILAAAPAFLGIFVPLFGVLGYLVRNVEGRVFGVALLAAALPAGLAAWRVYERRERLEADRTAALDGLRKRIRAIERELEN